MKTAIYKARVSTPWGYFLIAIDSIEYGAKRCISDIAHGEFSVAYGMLKVDDVKKSNRRILKRMLPIKNARCWDSDDCWAWICRDN